MQFINYLEAVLVVAISFVVARILVVVVKRRLHGELPVHVTQNLTKGIYYALIAVGIGIAIGITGINVTGLLVTGGVVGIILGLALQSTLSNFFAGLLIIFEKPFTVGQVVNYQGVIGTVVDIGLLSTKLYSWEGHFVRVPNSVLFTSQLVNYSKSIVRLVRIQFTVFQESDLNRIMEAVKNKLNEQWYVLVNPEVVVFPIQFTENGVQIEARAWTPQSTWFELYRNIGQVIDQALKELGVRYAYKKVILDEDGKR
ncbi:mechanosensitive ion channel family protein [Metallosphaera sedula]|uniref:Mechanosensitive ion channel family protein n=1 Tax=Metallosphaera prunae TaxID=47304 RepID=A0A4D8S681_METPR|nr:mechanosensitive ion channel family protein [Metallosphaera prunae]